MRGRTAGPTLAMLLVAVLMLVTGCGGDGADGDAGAAPEQPASPSARDFPAVDGRTLADLRADMEPGPIVAPSVSQFIAGRENRFAFGLFEADRTPVKDAQVALYTANRDGREVRGPFPGRAESLEVKPQFRSQTTASDPDAARTVYVADLPFERRGTQMVFAVVRQADGSTTAATEVPVRVGAGSGPPDVGDRAVKVSTPTRADVGGNLAEIDTRVPPGTMHEEDFAEVLGKKPAVLVFSTPALCQSRVCGPVVDIAEQVKAEYGDRAAFIHMEIFRNNRIQDGYRSQVGAWRLPSEPWAFAVDAEGKVAARLEGAFSARELTEAVERALKS